jgi:hypothetical protein
MDSSSLITNDISVGTGKDLLMMLYALLLFNYTVKNLMKDRDMAVRFSAYSCGLDIVK